MTQSDGITGQVLAELRQLNVQMAIAQTKLDALPDHEARLRSLERFRWGLGALVASGGSAAGWLAAWLTVRH